MPSASNAPVPGSLLPDPLFNPPNHLIQLLCDLRNTCRLEITNGDSDIKSLHDAAVNLHALFQRINETAANTDTIDLISTRLISVLGILKEHQSRIPNGNHHTKTGFWTIAGDLNRIRLTITLHDNVAFSPLHANSDHATKIEKALRGVLIACDDISMEFNPNEHRPNGETHYLGKGADIRAARGKKVLSHNVGPYVLDYCHADIESKTGEVASSNRFSGANGVHLALAAKISADGDVLSHNKGRIGRIDIRGANIVCPEGHVLSHNSDDNSYVPMAMASLGLGRITVAAVTANSTSRRDQKAGKVKST